MLDITKPQQEVNDDIVKKIDNPQMSQVLKLPLNSDGSEGSDQHDWPSFSGNFGMGDDSFPTTSSPMESTSSPSIEDSSSKSVSSSVVESVDFTPENDMAGVGEDTIGALGGNPFETRGIPNAEECNEEIRLCLAVSIPLFLPNKYAANQLAANTSALIGVENMFWWYICDAG